MDIWISRNQFTDRNRFDKMNLFFTWNLFLKWIYYFLYNSFYRWQKGLQFTIPDFEESTQLYSVHTCGVTPNRAGILTACWVSGCSCVRTLLEAISAANCSSYVVFTQACASDSGVSSMSGHPVVVMWYVNSYLLRFGYYMKYKNWFILSNHDS